MKPDFALSLSMEGIVFMCRAETGWHVIGEVPLEHRDLGAALADLRAEGEALVEGPALCKLILPNDQIRYLQIEATDADAESQVAAALEGATPYAVHELAYDFTEVDDVFLVAAVARETLQEAEGFAVEHGFAPVCFVAVPDEGAFDGEPYFGTSHSAAGLIDTDSYPEPDQEAAFITGTGGPMDFAPLFSTLPEPVAAPSFASRRAAPEAPAAEEQDPAPVVAAPDEAPPLEPRVTQSTIVAPAEPVTSPGLSETAPRFDPAKLAAGMKPQPKGTAVPALEVANPPVAPKQKAFVAEAITSPTELPRRKAVALYVIATIMVLLAALISWAALFTPMGVATLWSRSDAPVVASTPIDSDVEILAPVSPESITDTAEIEAIEGEGLYDPVEASIEPRLEAEARYAATGIWDLAPRQPNAPQFESSEDIYVGSFELLQQTHDAIALPVIGSFATDTALAAQFDPLPAGTVLDLDERGLVVATREGALSPEWITVFAGKPPVVPAFFPTRAEPETVEPAPESSLPEAIAALAAFRPQSRPEDLVEQNERATLGGSTRLELAGLRPRLRPEDPAFQAAAAVVTSIDPANLEGATEQAVLASLRPALRPADLSAKAEQLQQQRAAVAVPKAETTAPNIPSSASVARNATQTNAINLRKINLIGVYGTSNDRRALVRLASGRYKKVQVGDTLDGGRVAAIGESELRYVKGSRSIVLALPKG